MARSLGRASHARHRQAGVHRRADAGVEQVALQVDLPVGDRDDVGGDIGRHVARLGLDDGQGRQRAAAIVGMQLGRPLQQARVQVEHVAGIGLAARRPAQQQRHLAVGPGVLGQIVVDDQRILALLHELLAHGAAGVGGDVLQGGRFRSRGDDHDGVLHRAVFLQRGDHLGDLGQLLADGDIDADQVLALLVDDGVDGQGRLAGLPVADDQLALSTANGDHRVDGLDAGLYRRVHALAGHHVGRDPLDGAVLV